MRSAPAAARPPGLDWFVVCGYRFGVISRTPLARRLLRRLYGPAPAPGPGPGPAAARGAAAPAHAATAPRAAAVVFRLDPPAVTRRRGGGPYWRVGRGEGCLATCRSLGAGLRQLEYAICQGILAHRPDLLLLHGALVVAAGGAALITGDSGVGKTTLALALAAHGYRVAGDDLAVLDPRTGAVQALPRGAHVDAHSWQLLRRVGLPRRRRIVCRGFVTPADLGGRGSRTAPVPVRWVVLLRRDHASGPRLAGLSHAEGTVRLLPQAQWSAGTPAGTLRLLGRLVGATTCACLRRDQLPAMVAALQAHVGPP